MNADLEKMYKSPLIKRLYLNIDLKIMETIKQKLIYLM